MPQERLSRRLAWAGVATIEVRSDPDAATGAYRETRIARRGKTLTGAAVPGVQVEVASLIP
jgi:hypothetical protein